MEAEMRSRFACIIGWLFSMYLVMTIGSRAAAQIEFAPSTLQLKAATDPIAMRPIAATEQVVSQQATPNADDPAPAPSAAPNESPENRAAHQTARPANSLPTVVEPQFKNRSRPLVNPYASASAQTAMNKMPRPMEVQSAPTRQPARLRGKPFQAVASEPAISPYLSLYQNNSNQNQLLNYYTVVRPQMEQIEANKKQEAELQKLRAQVQNVTQGGAKPQPMMGNASSSDGMTVSAHYMDTAQFYQQRKHK
jgi:hypothetical protein